MAAATVFKASPQSKYPIRRLFGKLIIGKKPVHTFYADGVPTNDTDLAIQGGDLCLNGADGEVYVASGVTSATTTWTKIVG